MDSAEVVTDCAGYDGSQIRSIGNGRVGNYIFSNAVGLGLFTVDKDQLRQLGLGHAVDDIGGGQLLFGVETHIERAIYLKAEAAPGTGKLKRGQAKVEEYAIGPRKTGLSTDIFQVVEVVVDNYAAFEIIVEIMLGKTDCLGVGIDAEQPAAGLAAG
jgi:hypothetical protein